MPYNYFPATVYNEILVTDILKKFKMSDRAKNSTAVENYRVKEEDTPESLAYLLYRDTTFSWIVLMMNDITDRNNEWPYSYQTMVNLIDSKYPTSSVFLFDSDITFTLSDSTHFVVDGDEYPIQTVDRNFNKIVTTTKLPLSVVKGDTIRFYNEQTLLKTSTIRRVVYEDEFSVHHFQDDNGLYLDPRETVDGSEYTEQQTYLYHYINNENGGGDEYRITNKDYEFKINDDKRNILLLLPEYKDAFLSNISRLFVNLDKKSNIVEELDNLTINWTLFE